MNKISINMSGMLLTYVSNGQEKGVRDMYQAMHTYGLIDTMMWNEWNHLIDLLGRIRAMEGDEIHSFETRMKLLVQVLDEAKEFDSMDEAIEAGAA